MHEQCPGQGEDNRFGALCLTLGFISPCNLNLALEEQALIKKQGRQIPIGKLLVESGMISPCQREAVLTTQEELRSRVYIL